MTGRTHARQDGFLLGIERKLWNVANALRSSVDAPSEEYGHVVRGIIFGQDAFDAFEANRGKPSTRVSRAPIASTLMRTGAPTSCGCPSRAGRAGRRARGSQTTASSLTTLWRREARRPFVEGRVWLLERLPAREDARPALDKQRMGQLIGLVCSARATPTAARCITRGREGDLNGAKGAEGRRPNEKNGGACEREVADVIRTACTAIRLLRLRGVITTPLSARLVVPPASVFPALKRNDWSNRRYAQAISVFEEPVRAPVLIGAGRYRGCGVYIGR